MHRSGLIKSCVALLVVSFLPACQHSRTPPPAETVRLPGVPFEGMAALSAGGNIHNSLYAYYLKHGQYPHSIQDLCPEYMPAGSIVAACEAGSAGAQFLIGYTRIDPQHCTVDMTRYGPGGVKKTSRRFYCNKGKLGGGPFVTY
jgi:hypothetical protein